MNEKPYIEIIAYRLRTARPVDNAEKSRAFATSLTDFLKDSRSFRDEMKEILRAEMEEEFDSAR